MGLLTLLTEIKWKYIINKSYVRFINKSNYTISKSCRIKKSKIYIYPNASIEIGDNVHIENSEIHITKGSLIIEDNSIIRGSIYNKCNIIINDGHIKIGSHTKISNERIWVRFGGKLTIGDYTNINVGGEIRCDELIDIGSYNQISYDVNIWDTNTHNILPSNQRRNQTKKYFPYFGYEENKPKTAPIIIGDDCWIGEKVSILKGTMIEDEVIIGYNTTIINSTIPSKSTVVPIVDNKIKK